MTSLARDLFRPDVALRTWGHVLDQKTGKFVKYDPYRITEKMQATILAYFSDPPKTETGQNIFLNLIGYRQGGKSLAAEYAAYVKTAYTPGWDHVCIADVAKRARYLHGRVHHLHERWDPAIRSPTVPHRESLQLTFDKKVGGKMRISSAEKGIEGIGQSPDSFHASEGFLWRNYATSLSFILPSMINRDHALFLSETTPGPAGSDIHDAYKAGKLGDGRFRSVFFPFWDGKLNRRPWKSGWSMTIEEQRLLEKYARKGLTKEHLAFRREMLANDAEIRRNPELFGMYYPFDDVTCWVAGAGGVIPPHVLERHRNAQLVDWPTGTDYKEYRPPRADALYVIGDDPSGFAARDHHAFQVLEVWEDELIQAATFAAHVDPIRGWQKVLATARRYNNALVVFDSTGVGQAMIALAEDYENLYYEKRGKAGVTFTPKSIERMTGNLIDELMDRLTLYDADTVDQLSTYKHDKLIEDPVKTALSTNNRRKQKRDRHHWDKISALMLAVEGARSLPNRKRPERKRKAPDNLLLHPMMTWAEWEHYQRQVARDTMEQHKRPTFRSRRRF